MLKTWKALKGLKLFGVVNFTAVLAAQGCSTFSKYERKFNKLSNQDPESIYLPYAEGESWKKSPQNRFEEKLRTWVGQDAFALVASWGAPDRHITFPNGQSVITYRMENVQWSHLVGAGHAAFGQALQRDCEVTFIIDDKNVVRGFRREGIACSS